MLFVFCCRFDFICVPIVNPRFRREFLEGPAKSRQAPLTRSDLLLNSNGLLFLHKNIHFFYNTIITWMALKACLWISVDFCTFGVKVWNEWLNDHKRLLVMHGDIVAMCSKVVRITTMRFSFNFANAFTATSWCHVTAWSSAEWRRARSPSENLVCGHDSNCETWCINLPFVQSIFVLAFSCSNLVEFKFVKCLHGKEGKGLGKGGTKHHRKVLRDQGITNPAIRRLALHAGVKHYFWFDLQGETRTHNLTIASRARYFANH